jgi:hypothetical protein
VLSEPAETAWLARNTTPAGGAARLAMPRWLGRQAATSGKLARRIKASAMVAQNRGQRTLSNWTLFGPVVLALLGAEVPGHVAALHRYRRAPLKQTLFGRSAWAAGCTASCMKPPSVPAAGPRAQCPKPSCTSCAPASTADHRARQAAHRLARRPAHPALRCHTEWNLTPASGSAWG